MSGAVQVVGPSASTSRFYRPELDVVRFLAFLAVFCHHTLPAATHNAGGRLGTAISACGFGLPLFFVLSAYLIGELLLREKDKFKTIHMKAFYTRRILRIWPLYFFGLFLGCLYAAFIGHERHDILLLSAFAAMVGNWAMAIWPTSNPMSPLWSISVEEQFYLFCPLAIATLPRRGLAVFSVGLIVLSDIVLFLFGQQHANVDKTVWYSSFVHFQMFGAGLLLCLSLHKREFACPAWLRSLYLLSAPCLWYAACAVFDVKRQHALAKSGADLVLGYTCVTLGCVLLLRGMMGIRPARLPRWAVWLGRMSFGLYVYHLLASYLVRMVFGGRPVLWLLCSLALTVAMAAVSYRWLEMPFLRLKRRFELIETR